MELFKIFGTIALNNSGANDGINETASIAEKAHSKISSAFSKIGDVAVAAGKVIASGLAVGATAIGALSKQAVEGYADYEQLVGGVETLFGTGGMNLEEYAASVGKAVDEVKEEYKQLINSEQDVLTNAANAYKTAGLSANEYMETVTSFSASLIQSVGGDTVEAARLADQAITDMSDNANKMGTSIESIQNAYQGFAKQNYTMLDNLKLGYGGTKEEMERLLEDAEKLSGIEYDMSSYADIVDAIHVVQTEMGITGTTAKEASKTISGSLSAAKAAWKNLLVGMADENANFESLIEDFVESVGVAAENIIPRIEVALMGAAELVDKLVPIIIEKVPQIIHNLLPKVVRSAVSIVQGLVDGIKENQKLLTDTVLDVGGTIINTILTMIPQIVQLGFDLIVSLAEGIADNITEIVAVAKDVIIQIVKTLTNAESMKSLLDSALVIILAIADGIVEFLPELVDSAISVISQIVETLTDTETLEKLLDATLEIILAIAEGLVEFLPELISAAGEIATKLVEFLLEEDNLQKLIDAALVLLEALATGLLESVGVLLTSAGDLTAAFIEAILEVDWLQVGADIVMGIGEGIINAWDNLVTKNPKAADLLSKVGNALQSGGIGDSLVGTVNYTGQSMWVAGSHADGLDYVPYDGYIAELHKGEMVVPEDASRRLRSGIFNTDNGEVVALLERILDAVKENGTTETSLVLNNREFARMVKAVK